MRNFGLVDRRWAGGATASASPCQLLEILLLQLCFAFFL